MIKIENWVLPSPEQWKAIIRGMRNPMNSWEKSDSYTTYIEDKETLETAGYEFFIGENDLNLMNNLVSAGTDHRKFMRMIPVYLDITAPLYWWKEFDTYAVGVVKNSCSTMHKLTAKEFEPMDFSCERLDGRAFDILKATIDELNYNREKYLKARTKKERYWDNMIQLLPSSYNQKRTVMLNYEVLANMYHARKNHKLYEWRKFCNWIETLPYSELITGKDNEDAGTTD